MEKLPAELRPEQFRSLHELYNHVVNTHAPHAAYTCFNRTLSFLQVDALSDRLALWLLRETSLEPGDRIAIQLPNLLQFPIALIAAVKAGLVVVTTNPLYTAHEMERQFANAQVKGIVILDSFCAKLEQVISKTAIDTVIVTRIGDLQPRLKGKILNAAVKYIARAVPSYHLPQAISFLDALQLGVPMEFMEEMEARGELKVRRGSGDDVAVIMYTGGTTGVAKGAMLSHNNLIANMMQLRSRCAGIIEDRIETLLAPLPLYHSYAFLLNGLAMPFAGNHSVLIPNPRDIKNVIRTLKRYPISGLVGINTLYQAMMRHRDFPSIDFSELKFCGAGGMPMSTSVAAQWTELTGTEIYEGYGLTECSPVVAVNTPDAARAGTVGKLVPETELRVVDGNGNEVPAGEQGEAWVRGPQVMSGYWQREEETREALTEDGWFKTGDYVEVSADGFISIVDRKKDMILVSGFNVFPNEIEDWVNQHPDIVESAAIGIPDEKTGERIRLFVVCGENKLEEAAIIAHCRTGLTAYKLPKEIVYAETLPKSIIGKILRKELRN